MATLTIEIDTANVEKVKDFVEALSKPKVKETHVGVALDSSGSMYPIKSDTIGAYNSFVDTLSKDDGGAGKIYTTLATFGEGYGAAKLKYAHKPLSALVKLDDASYVPSGNTPMFDAIWLVITNLEVFDVPGKDVAFLVNIFTDGYENASEFGRQQAVAEKIKALQAKGNWTFTFTGANVDLDKIHQQTNIPLNNMMLFQANAAGVAMMNQQHVNSTQGYLAVRSTGASASADFYGNNNS